MKNILFDLYGTLIDIHTEEEQISFWRKLAKRTKQYGIFEAEELKRQYKALCQEKEKSKEEIDVLEVFQELYQVDFRKANRIAVLFRRLSTKYIRLYKGVSKLLRTLKKEGFRLYVLSNAQEVFTMPELERLRILKYFDGIAISSVYGIKKPNVEFFKQALAKFQISEAIMIGNDLRCDIEPAHTVGLSSIFIESNLTEKTNTMPDIVGFHYREIYQKIHTIVLNWDNSHFDKF